MDKGLGVCSGGGCWGGEKGLKGYGWESVYECEFVCVYVSVRAHSSTYFSACV